ncbi:MAG: DUF4296 domain-containing protein, partial [Bacteroidales bacterium]|nr:DUF4296 domain-containing protein [Bacteroidales bacterium]
ISKQILTFVEYIAMAKGLLERWWKLVLAVLLAAPMLLCSCQKEKVLGKEEVAQIMSELFIADQYAKTYQEVFLKADSILLYQHIFDAHNTTLEEYQKAITHYIQNEKEYTAILQQATQLLKEKADEANKEADKKITLFFDIPSSEPKVDIIEQMSWWKRSLLGTPYKSFFTQLQEDIALQEKPLKDGELNEFDELKQEQL